MPNWIDAIVQAGEAPPPDPEPEPFLDPAVVARDGRFLAAARPWIALGANVMPVKPGTKSALLDGWGARPSKAGRWLARDWGLRATGSSLAVLNAPKIPGERYAEWAQRYRDHDALVFPATLDCVVIDVDEIELLPRVLEACGNTPYRTISGRAGGGVHLWYRGATASRNKIVPGVDVKSSGGIAILPGSRHTRTGLEYSASEALRAALHGEQPFDPPKIHADWRARVQNAASRLTRPGRLDLFTLADSLKANRRKRAVGRRLELVAQGKVFAEQGEKDTALFTLLAELAHWWPNAESDAIIALFEPSAQLMDPDCVIPIAEAVATKWERLTAQRAEQLDAAAMRAEDQRRVAWSLVGQHRSEQCDPFEAPIVVHKGRTYFVRIGEAWHGPITREDLSVDMIAALRSVYGIDSADLSSLLASYGQPLREIRHSYTAQRTELKHGVLEVATAPRDVRWEPRYSETVDRGLDLVCGQWADKVRHWIAGLTRQDRPSRALVLSGPRGVGKTLLLEGLARIWLNGAAQMRLVVGRRFNDGLLETPFAIADDDTSPSEQGQALAGYLRQAVSDRSQKIERKHMDVQTLFGCLRFAVATNDAMALVQGAITHKLNDESVSAFADRLLHVPTQETARGWWRHGQLEGEREDERTERLVMGGEIACHALWLAQQEQFREPDDRFWCGPGDQTLHMAAVLSSGLRGDILLHLGTPEIPGVKIVRDAYHVTVRDFVSGWQFDRPRGLTQRSGGFALKALANADPIPQPASGSKRIVAISMRLVQWYAAYCGV